MKKSFLKALVVLGVFGILVVPNPAFVFGNEDGSVLLGGDSWGMNDALNAGLNYGVLGPAAGFLAPNPIDAGRKVYGAVTDPIGTLEKALQNMITTGAYNILSLSQAIVKYVGKFFDTVLALSFNTNEFYGYFESSISVSWSIIRDIGNIAIVFSLLYLGIKTIIQGDGFADRKTLAAVLLAAVFINFSLFLTKAAFEVSTFIGEQIYTQIKYQGGGNQSISGATLRMVQGTEFNNYDSGNVNNDWQYTWGVVQHAILATFAIIGMAFIFAVGGLILLYRLLAFLFLMIASPIGLIAKFIPWLKGAGDQWWSNLKAQSLYLPAFALSMYVCLLVIGEITHSVQGSFNLGANGLDAMGLFVFKFAMVMGLLIAMLLIPLKVAGGGSDVMTKMSGWATNRIKALPRNAAQFGGRRMATATATVGRNVVGGQVGARLVNSEALKAATDAGGIKGSLARRTMATGDKLQKATFDVRNVGGLGKKMGLGVAQKGGYKERVEQGEKDAKKRQVEDFKLFGYGDRQKVKDELEDKLGPNYQAKLRSHESGDMEEGMRTLVVQLASARASGDTAGAAAIEARLTKVNDELLTLNKYKKDNKDAYISIAQNKKVGFEAYARVMESRIAGGNAVTRKLKAIRNGGNKEFVFNPKMKGYAKVKERLEKASTFKEYDRKNKKDEIDELKKKRSKALDKQLEDKDK